MSALPVKPWQARQVAGAATSAPTAAAPSDAPKPWELPGAGSTPRACPTPLLALAPGEASWKVQPYGLLADAASLALRAAPPTSAPASVVNRPGPRPWERDEHVTGSGARPSAVRPLANCADAQSSRSRG